MRVLTLAVFLTVLLSATACGQDRADTNVIGIFQGGQYAQYDIFRSVFRQQLDGLLPEGLHVVFAPDAFKTAGWNRDTCRAMAVELATHEKLDLVVALGPWVVEDLLEAGFDKPIIAVQRLDPTAEGLTDQYGRPLAKNLTVRVSPDRIEQDIRLIIKLVKVKKFGFLYFPSGSASDGVVQKVAGICNRLGIEFVAPEGYDNVGTYAFFKAYQSLDKDVDAVYVSSMCGFDPTKTTAFFEMAYRDKIPVFSFDGRYQVVRGAFAGAVSETMIGVARYHADKSIRILQGATPADLPTGFVRGPVLTFNEATARRCRIDIPENIRISADIITAPPPEDCEHYRLSTAITQALLANPGYLARHDALDAAAHAAGQAGAGYLPHLYATGRISHVDDNTVSNFRQGIQNNLYRTELSLSQQLLSLPTVNAIKLAGRYEDRQSAALDSATLMLEWAVTIAFLNCLQAAEFKTALSDHRLLIDRLSELARARSLLGEIDAADVLRWQYERQRLTRLMVEAENNLKVARVLFNLLLSQPGDTPFTLDTEAGSEGCFIREFTRLEPYFATERKAQRSEQYLADQALATNPHLLGHVWNVEIAKTHLRGNSYRYLPTIGLQAKLSFQDELNDVPPLFTEKSSTWAVGAQLAIPLFLGTDRIHERTRLRARLSQAEYLADNARITVIGRVRTAAGNFRAALTNTPVAAQSEEQARLYLETVADSYSGGDCSLAEILDATTTSVTARLDAIGTRHGFFAAAAGLVREIGLSIDESQTTPGETVAGLLSGSIEQGR
jgi:outer membrane protein TolC